MKLLFASLASMKGQESNAVQLQGFNTDLFAVKANLATSVWHLPLKILRTCRC